MLCCTKLLAFNFINISKYYLLLLFTNWKSFIFNIFFLNQVIDQFLPVASKILSKKGSLYLLLLEQNKPGQ